ncbi:MAG: hypothetical protein EBZ77_02595 [Chitinophagia bacterium]|nr:hypothetical protein [Chitinophagia bacterium]
MFDNDNHRARVLKGRDPMLIVYLLKLPIDIAKWVVKQWRLLRYHRRLVKSGMRTGWQYWKWAVDRDKF